jgi:dephospho-CoA kinase
MYCVGLTGTVASGKSLALDYFKSLTIDTISADQISRQLTQQNSPALEEMCQYFGNDILDHTGALNRRALRRHILEHPEAKQWLEALLHPKIRQQIAAAISHSQSPYCVIEIPLLADRITYPYLQRVLLITSQPETQIQRLMSRDHCSEKEASALLTHQQANDHRHTIADDIIMNNGSIAELHQKLYPLHLNYLRNAKGENSTTAQKIEPQP